MKLGNKLAELTVSEFADNLKFIIEDHFPYVKIRGEISGLKIHNSGHIYFNLKDDQALINAVCFKNRVNNLKIFPEEGQEIIVIGKISTYKARSNYQIIIENIESSILGSLMDLFLKLKDKLEKEGLFAVEHKKSLPKYPANIAVVTSESGAVFHDICHRIEARFPCLVSLYPVMVQGDGAALIIANAINEINELEKKPDIIILARGGGSVEDLWAFNEEIVARAIFNSSIPIISAIGHETDFTIADYVADIRAPTPTAAAEIATEDINEVRIKIDLFYEKISEKLINKINSFAKIFVLLKPIHPAKYLQHKEIESKALIHEIDALYIRFLEKLKRQIECLQVDSSCLLRSCFKKEVKLSELSGALESIFAEYMKNKALKLRSLSVALSILSYKNTLKRGYVIARDQQENIIKSASYSANIRSLEFHDGNAKIKINED